MRSRYAVLTVMFMLCLAFAAPAGDAQESKIYAYRLGGLDITALLDTRNEGKVDLLIGAGKEDLERAAAPGALAMSINAFLVKMDGKTILFDTGLPISVSGSIVPSLAEAGVAPDDIDAIVITHFHADHVGGLLKDGRAVYPRAELFIPRVEVDKWSDPGTDFLMVYGPRTNAFEFGAEILPGVTAIAAVGHTPGHTIYRLENGGGKLLIIGDLIHIPGVQLANPDVAVTYDKDPVLAVFARKQAFDMAAEQKLPVASMHIPFPGLGMLTKDGKGYAFEAVNK